MKIRPLYILTLACLALVGVLMSAKATPQKHPSAMTSLAAYERSGSKANTDEVVALIGFYGQDQPRQWLILARDNRLEGMMHEFVVSEGQVRAQRHFKRLANQDLPDIPIDPAAVKIDSGRAFQLVESLAAKAGVSFDSVHYQLRCRDLGREPVWMLNLIDSNQMSIGVHYFSAVTGALLRSTWYPEGVEDTKSAKGPIPKVGQALKKVVNRAAGSNSKQAQRTP